MKKSMSKNAVISLGLVFSAFSMTMVSIGFASVGMQGANVASSATSKIATVLPPVTIEGEHIISTSVIENFSKKESDRTERKIFIGSKGYEFTTNNIMSPEKDGRYSIKGTLDSRNKIILSSAKFLGEVPNEPKEEETKKISTTIGTKKPKRLAVFLLDSQDSSSQPFYPANINQMIFGNGKFASYFREASYNRQPIVGDVFGWFTLPGNDVCNPDPTNDLGPAIAGSPIDLNNYTNIVIITLCPGNAAYGFSNTSPQPWSINGTIYNKVVTWVNIGNTNWNEPSSQMGESVSGPHVLTNLEHLLIHEFGHALGLHHAHGISCTGTLPTENCQNIDLGNYFDTMAYNTIGLHFNAWAKAKLGWFTNTELGTITQSGTYNIASLESQPTSGNLTVLNSTPKAYKIKPSSNSNKTPIWIEFRKATGFDGGINTPASGGFMYGADGLPPHNISDNQNGIMVYKEGFDGTYSNVLNPKTAGLIYLRNAPNLGTSANPYQVSLNPGQTYSEPRYGLVITTLSPLNSQTRRFQVTMNPNLACTHLPPKVSTWGNAPATTIDPGNFGFNWSTTLRIINMDYISCPSANFSVSLGNVPTGITQENFNSLNVTQFLSNLAPDDDRIRSLNVYIGPNTSPGNYTLPITVTNTSSGLSTTMQFPVTVQ